MVPLPLEASGAPLPIESVLAHACVEGPIGTVPALAFRHAFAYLDPGFAASQHAAQAAFDCYRALLQAVGLRAVQVNGELHQSAPYNLLVTRRWMLLVPRSAECAEGVSVNALGFVGSLFVRNAAQMQVIKTLGPMNVLQRVAVPAVVPELPPSFGDGHAF
jgi:ATP adenylyltransferase